KSIDIFIAVYFNPDWTSPQPNNLITTAQFRGKVNFNIQGTDLDWKGAIYSGTINPLRVWTFQALSIDFALLEKVLINERITLEDGTKIRGIFGHIEGGTSPNNVERITTVETDAIFKPRLAYQGYTGGTDAAWFYSHFYRLGSLYDALQLIFDKAGKVDIYGVFSGILNEIYPGQDFVVLIDESILTIKTQPTGYRFVRNETDVPQLIENYEDTYIPKCTVYAANKKIQLKIAQDIGNANDIDSPIYIHERMFDARLNVTQAEPFKTTATSERSWNFQHCSNLAELLFEIARSLGCFVTLSLTGTNVIHVQFISRDSCVESEITQLIDAIDASIDISGNSNEGKMTTYNAIANTQAAEGIDTITTDGIMPFRNVLNGDFLKSFPGAESEKSKKRRADEDEWKKWRDIEIKKLLLSTSQTLEYHRFIYSGGGGYNPLFKRHGLQEHGGFITMYQPMNIRSTSVKIPTTETFYQLAAERLSTALYIRVKKNNMAYDVDDEPYYNVGVDDNLFCPAFGIHIKKNIGTYDVPVWEEKKFGYSLDDPENNRGLSDYINYLMQIDEQFYIQEYSLDIPYWNGFKKGVNIGWNQIKLGSLIQLTWNVINYSGGVFTETPITKTFVVNEIERNYQKPETKLKLHYEGRFSYASSDAVSSRFGGVNEESFSIPDLEHVKEFTALENITAGDAVMIYSTGVIRGIPRHDYYGTIIGIARNSAAINETVYVQISGRVYNENYTSIFTGHIGEYVYCRKSTYPTLNVSINCLISETSFEDIIWILGKIETVNTFVLGIIEIPYGGHYPEPSPP
ncbi:MAG: hypothetical protein M1419_08600, partial [Bacteroidetes bacterium]|nr:hypothetical protein [Bacteroidota bacterium]